MFAASYSIPIDSYEVLERNGYMLENDHAIHIKSGVKYEGYACVCQLVLDLKRKEEYNKKDF